MCLCWEENSEDRPTFADISTFLGSLLSKRKSEKPDGGEGPVYDYAQLLSSHPTQFAYTKIESWIFCSL